MEQEEIILKILALKSQLSSNDSQIGDWKNLKQLDTGEYTEEEMAEYRAKRAEARAEIARLRQLLDGGDR